MMKFPKSSKALVDFFERVAPGVADGAEARKMFGYPCRFVNGNLFMGLHGEKLILRLPEADRETFIKQFDTTLFEPFPGRVMKEYVVVPKSLFKKEKALAAWVEKSFQYASAIPRKKK